MLGKTVRCALIFGGCLLASCASTRPGADGTGPDVDPPWTENDQQAVEELAAALPPARETHALTAEADVAAPPPPDAADHLLEIYVFNIGQADSLLVIGPAPGRRTLLIDLGEPTQGSRLPSGMVSSADHVLDRIQQLTGEPSVDYFVATHYHADHLGYGADRAAGWGAGVIRLLSDFSLPFSVGEFIHVQNDGAEYMKSASRRGVYTTITRRMPIWEQHNRVGSSVQPRFGTTQIDLGPGVSVDILAFAGKVPSGESAFDRAVAAGVDYTATPGNENDLSIALKITAGEFELFTGGDLNGTDDPVAHPLYVLRDFGEIYTNVEHRLVSHWESEGIESDVEIYRANHHGSDYSSTERLLDALDPEFILYSTGADHGHPSNSVVARGALTARQLATTWVTDFTAFRNGRGARVGEIAILVAPDGKSYTINGVRHLAFSAPQEAAGDDEGEEDQQH